MGFALRAGISFCEVSERLLFLDTVADRYFCLPPNAEHGFRQIVAGTVLDDTDRDHLAGMLRSGTLVETVEHRTPAPFRSSRHASLSLLDASDPPASTISVAHARLHLLAARFSLRHRPLHAILRGIDLAKTPWPRSGDVDPEALQAAASAFERTTRFMRSHDQCLSRSIAMARYLAARNLPADLMIGVRLRPFAAHCWVQSGRWLVNDQIDTIRTYTPILAV